MYTVILSRSSTPGAPDKTPSSAVIHSHAIDAPPQRSLKLWAHVTSSSCPRFSYNPTGHRGACQEKQSAIGRHFTTAESYAANSCAGMLFRFRVEPLSITEKKSERMRAKIFLRASGLGQLRVARALLGCGDRRTALKRLYLCGAHANPGRALTGITGKNAAREILRNDVDRL